MREELRFRLVPPEDMPKTDVIYPYCFYRIAYRTAPHDAEMFAEVVRWCMENLTPPREDNLTWASDGYRSVVMRDEAEATAFRMRWC